MTFHIHKQAEQDAIAHALREYPKEAVGAVIDDEYHPFINIATDPEDNFLISEPDSLTIAIRPTQCVIHSHPFVHGNRYPMLYPSATDMQTQLSMEIPWGIIACDKERAWPLVWFGDQLPIAPLEGRIFIHGVYDCFGLIRDYYRLTYGITIKEFPRDWEWWNNGQNLYEEGIADAGFVSVPLSDIRTGDVFLAATTAECIHKGVAHHGGIFIGGSGDKILHHKCWGIPYDPGHLSSEENGMRYMRYMTHILRNKALL